MKEFISLFINYPFFTNAILIGILASVSFGIMGSLVVANKLTFLAGGISHSAYAGIGLAFFMNFNPMIGIMLAGVSSAIIIGTISLHNKKRSDAIIGVVWAVGMSLGIILLDLTPGYKANLMNWLFGSITAVTRFDLITSLVLDIIVILSIVFFYKEVLSMSYDDEYAKICGVPVKFIYFYLLILTSLTIVILIRIIGLIMLIAMLTIPALIAERFSHSLKFMMIISTILTLIFLVGGFVLSYYLNVSSSAVIILFASFIYGASFILVRIKREVNKTR